MAKRLVIADFETQAIEPRPSYPPRPAGLALQEAGRREYLAFGHPAGNNCKEADARRRLEAAWNDPDVELVFHNSKFDVDVAQTHWKLPALPWRRTHDTLFQLYLDDPRASSLSLKPSAERLLGLPPEERDAVRDWLVSAGIVKSSQKDWGAHIAKAPPTVVGPYATGDVKRTAALHAALTKSLKKRGMLEAYDRERRLMPILLESETRGIRVDQTKLKADVLRYTAAVKQLDAWLRRRLGAGPLLNLDSSAELAEALEARGLVTEWVMTPGGARSTAMKNLRVNDKRVRSALTWRAKTKTSLETFMEPWLENAKRSGGYTYTNWNQVRGENDKGTRTGRMSSNPNWQNLSNPFEQESELKLPIKLPPLPRVKDYVLPDEGEVILSLDYSQQELRALAHFEDGALLDAYRENPRMDVHEFARGLINQMMGTNFSRKPIKTIGFGLIYGMGLDLLAANMGIDVDEARRLKRAYLSILPGINGLIAALTQRARAGLPIRTWGGREYYVEPPKLVNGVMRTFEYKLLNLIIQGSCADATKEALCRYYEYGGGQAGRFLAQVHDQLLVSTPRRRLRETHELLRSAMESVEFDVPMLTDATVGESWGSLKPLEE